jgi:hypothetical protein
MKVRHVRPLSASELASLCRQRLDAYRRKLLTLPESAGMSDLSETEFAQLIRRSSTLRMIRHGAILLSAL